MDSGQVSLTKKPSDRSHRGDETTRRLCAGVYVDRKFRDLVIKDVIGDFRHRVAPSYGFDLAPVAEHAWRAWILDTIHHTCLVIVLIVTAVLNPPAAITLICAVGLLRLVRPTGRLLPRVLKLKALIGISGFFHLRSLQRELKSGDTTEGDARTLKLALAATGVFIAAPPLAIGAAGASFRAVAGWAAGVLLLMAAWTAQMVAVREQCIAGTHAPDRSWLGRRLRAIATQQDETVVVFRRPPPKADERTGRLRPKDPGDWPGMFVGGGELVHRWLPPVNIRLLRPSDSPLQDMSASDETGRREHVKPPFEAHELVEYLRRKMRPIGHRSDPGRLPGYQIKDRVYVAAADAFAARDQVAAVAGPDTLSRIIDAPDGPLQHFLEIRATSSGELVTTVFLRVTIKARTLSLDFAACALTRTPEEYEHRALLASGALRSALTGLSRFPEEFTRAWRLIRAPRVLIRVWQARKAAVKPPLAGPQTSVRHEQAADWSRAATDHPTILDHMKIIEGRLLRATQDFLRDHDVDTSAFERRAETIISANVLNMGQMDITGSAVGDNAQVNKNTPEMEGAQ